MKNLRIILLLIAFIASINLQAANKVNINTANAQQLASGMKNIGPEKASAIVKYREQHGPYNRIEDLAKVKGIGEKTITLNREIITVK